MTTCPHTRRGSVASRRAALRAHTDRLGRRGAARGPRPHTRDPPGTPSGQSAAQPRRGDRDRPAPAAAGRERLEGTGGTALLGLLSREKRDALMAVFSHPDTATPTIAEATKRERKENLQNNMPQSLRPGGKPVPRTARMIRRSPSPATSGGEKRRNTSGVAAAAAPRSSPRAPSATFLPSRCLPTSHSPAGAAAPPAPRHPHRSRPPPARCGPDTHLGGEGSPRLPLLQEPLFPLSPPPRYSRRLCPEPDTERN